MSAFKKGIAIVLAGAFAAGIAGTIAYPQGAVTLVQLVLGGTLVSSSNPLPITCESGCSGGGGGETVTQGPQGTNAAGWWVWLGDGTNGPVAVKPANTAPTTNDAGLVVNINCAYSGSPCIPLGPAAISASLPTALSSQYPTNSTTTNPTAVTNSATGTTNATAATLAATSGVTNFVCGFSITADATALAVGTAVLSGTISGSLSYLQSVLASTSGTSILQQNFSPCIPASAANTAITITSAAAGTGGNTIVNIWGYRL